MGLRGYDAMKPLPNLGCNLFVGHFINRFNFDNAASEIVFLKTFFPVGFSPPLVQRST